MPFYRLIGGIFNRVAEAETLALEFERALADLQRETWPKRQVLYLIWHQPWMGGEPEYLYLPDAGIGGLGHVTDGIRGALSRDGIGSGVAGCR